MFETEAVVRLQHTDAAGRIYFARIFELAHVAYEELLDAVGESIPADMAGAAYIIPIVHAQADFRSPLRVGDRVTIGLAVTKLRGRSFTIEYTLARADGAPAGTVTTVHVVVDPQTGKAATMPDRLRDGLARYVKAV